MSFEIPGVLWRRDPQAAEVPLVFELAAQRIALSRGLSLLLPARLLANRRGCLCRRALCGCAGIGRDIDRRGIPAQLSRPQPGGRRSRHRADRRPWPGACIALSQDTRRARRGAPRRPARDSDLRSQADGRRDPVPGRALPYPLPSRARRDLPSAPTANSASSGTSTAIRCRPSAAARRAGNARILSSAIATARPAPPNSPISSRGLLRGRGYTVRDQRGLQGGRNRQAAGPPGGTTGTACRSRSTAHSTWTRRRWKRPPASPDCRPTSPI